MGFKKQRIGLKLIDPAARRRYRDVHVFFGGTGAVGGTAVLQMISMYEEMFSYHRPGSDEVPVLVATGRTAEERRFFTRRLFRYVESRHGAEVRPERMHNGYLLPSGVFVDLEPFEVVPFPGLENLAGTPAAQRPQRVSEFLRARGTHLEAPAREVYSALEKAVAQVRPFSEFLRSFMAVGLKMRPDLARFRSVQIGIPLPSLMAYHLSELDLAGEYIPGLTDAQREKLKEDFVTAVRNDVAVIQKEMADEVLIAHTTSVGGMYDEEVGADGHPHRTIRLGFAHSAQDTRLIEKQKFADRLTDLYTKAGMKILITAAAIGIDEVRVRDTIPVHQKVARMLRESAAGGQEIFPGSTQNQVQRVYRPATFELVSSPPGEPVLFDVLGKYEEPSPGRKDKPGNELRPSYTIRSGENGFFSVANAEALYRVMKVASASELSLVMAQVGIFGDDPQSPWFGNGGVCYYTETDNSRQVFDFLAQPMLRQTQLSGIEPMALQDLGSAKHQGELHTLSLLILLHRLRTLAVDAIPPFVDIERFDARGFFERHSRHLTFEDLLSWDFDTLASDLAVLASAESPEDLEELSHFQRRAHDELFPQKREARLQVLDVALKAVWAIPSLGSPLVYEAGGRTMVRTGYFVAPLDLLVRQTGDIEGWFHTRHQASGNRCSLEEFRDFHIASGGFVDLRPHALVAGSKNDREDLSGKVTRVDSEDDLRTALGRLTPYSVFSTCGLLAVIYRLRALYFVLQEAMIDLGTAHEFRWSVPRDENGHIIVLPGAVEALRMVSEGLEKTTGTERLDGGWGY